MILPRESSWHYSRQTPAFFFPVCPCCAAITTRAYDWSGTELWTADHGNTVTAIALDDDGNVYTFGFRRSGITFRVYDPDGVEDGFVGAPRKAANRGWFRCGGTRGRWKTCRGGSSTG